MATVYSYLRFSRPEQTKGDSLRRQVEKSKDWAERNKLRLDESLRDRGVSAFRSKNARDGNALGRFLEQIQNGRVKSGDYLILENLDRLSRDEVFDKAIPLVRSIITAGVTIVTLDPERTYSRESLKDIGTLFQMLLSFFLANEESRKKSERLCAAWSNKRHRASDKKLTALCPGWLRLSEDRTKFEPIQDRVAVVRKIYRLAAEGAGAIAIAKRLNADGEQTFGRGKQKAKFWQQSSIIKILASRAVLGEYHPHRMQDGKRVTAGEPVADYFPAVIEQASFYATQRGKAERKGNGGRNGERVTNLFTGLVKDARDGSSLIVVNKGDGPSLVSTAARMGTTGSVYVSFPYAAFEKSLLVWGYDLGLADVLPRKATDLESELHKSEGRLAHLESDIGKIKAHLKTAGDIDPLLDALVEFETERQEEKTKSERLKGELATPASDAIDGLRKLLRQVKQSKGPALFELRLKLRQFLKRVVSDIVVLVIQVNRVRVALVDIKLQSGIRRRVTIIPPGAQVALPEGLAEHDIRNWKKWPKRHRETKFKVTSDEAHSMVELEKSGLQRTEIAERLGVSRSHVSRTLLRCGRRKQVR